MSIKLKNLIKSILLAEGVGLASALLSGVFKGGFYDSLWLPPLAPPGWVFPVVWVILYACMGIAAYLVDLSHLRPEQKGQAVTLYLLQLFVNFLWSIVFFRWEMLFGALVVIVILDILVVLTIMAFRKVDQRAAKLMIPYLLWILFATYLNLGIWLLN